MWFTTFEALLEAFDAFEDAFETALETLEEAFDAVDDPTAVSVPELTESRIPKAV